MNNCVSGKNDFGVSLSSTRFLISSSRNRSTQSSSLFLDDAQLAVFLLAFFLPSVVAVKVIQVFARDDVKIAWNRVKSMFSFNYLLAAVVGV